MLKWEATIHNLDDPRHRGKEYRLLIEIPSNYPFIAPKVRFIDHVKCENVFYDGEVCVDILKDAWSPAYTLWSLLEAIASLLTDRPVSGLVNKVRTVSENARYRIETNNIIPTEPVENTIVVQIPRRRRTELELLLA
jgi:ubiquitin-protein ligase